MTHCCSQCNFTAQFESALMMHHQLHHETGGDEDFSILNTTKEKSSTIPRVSAMDKSFSATKDDKIKLGVRTPSTTRLFEKLRARLCRSRALFTHPENGQQSVSHEACSSAPSECTSKALKLESTTSKTSAMISTLREDQKEIYGCHLCSFNAERITVLDRHLLNDHKIGLDNLLKLVMSKTKDALAEDTPNIDIYGIRQPYYKPPDDIIEEGEFVIETVTPKIKILKHTSTNTETQWNVPDLKDNCRMISKELEELTKFPINDCDKNELLAKMQTLNECMCKIVDSSNTLKKMLAKEFDAKLSVRDENLNVNEPFFDLGLGDQESPRNWDRAQSEKAERNRKKYEENCRGDKSKYSSDSFYF